MVEISRAEFKDEALAGLDTWKARHPEVVSFLEPADILVDGMRGRSAVWYRVRVNLIHVPEVDRPTQEPLESDFEPWAGQDIEAWKAATAGPRAREADPEAEGENGNEGRCDGRAGARQPVVTPEADAQGSSRRSPRSANE